MTGSRGTLDPSPRFTQVRMAPEWYIDAGGRVEGPISTDELNDRAAGGDLAPTDSVSADRVTWVPANTVPGLSFPARARQPLTQTVVSGSVYATPADAAVESGALPVVTVNGYTILDTLGAGACGVVYKARQEKLNRVVALKTILMPDKASADLLSRFQQEAVSLAKLHHPNIVAVFDSGMCATPSGQAFFAMELLDGEDLDVRLERTGPMPEQAVWLIARQTAAALADAAKHGIIHRDVKPANLFLVTPPTGFPLPEGVPMVKVTDFGLALSRAEGDQRQSVAGTLLGTPVYMAPEQFAGSDVDVRADIYGLGCTVYHALTGAPPFDGRTVWDVMMKKSAPAPRLEPPVSPETADLVASMLAIAPDQRPRDYADLIARIDALPCLDVGQGNSGRILVGSGRHAAAALPAAESKPEPSPVLARPRSRRRWAYAAAVVALLGACAGAAFLAGLFDQRPATYVTGDTRLLYNAKSAFGWQPEGASWSITKDDDKTPVLTGQGVAVRPFEPPVSNFFVTLTVNPYQASAVDVVLATTDGPSPTRWLVRLEPAVGASFGKRVGSGPFEPVGNTLRIPTADELKARGGRPYLEIKYARAGKTLSASFHGEPLGETSAAGLRTTELRIEAIGGPVRIDTADLTELIEQK